MRTKLVAGNWKMNKLMSDARKLFNELNDASGSFPDGVEVMIAPPAPYLAWLAADSTARLHVGAQDVAGLAAAEGAFTGEVSAAILRSAGIKYAIIGHSERRLYHSEGDTLLSKKIEACIHAGIVPVFCCGEQLGDRDAGNHIQVVQSQVRSALKPFDASALKQLVVAYEPVWAIGTGRTASAAQAQEMHQAIRSLMSGIYGESFANSLRILYGGSLKPGNAEEIFSMPDIDGGLIGGASLVATDFIPIIQAAG